MASKNLSSGPQSRTASKAQVWWKIGANSTKAGERIQGKHCELRTTYGPVLCTTNLQATVSEPNG